MSEHTCTCDFCRDEFPLSDLIVFHGVHLCEGCYENETSYCDVCGERVWDDDLVCDGRMEICPTCLTLLKSPTETRGSCARWRAR